MQSLDDLADVENAARSLTRYATVQDLMHQQIYKHVFLIFFRFLLGKKQQQKHDLKNIFMLFLFLFFHFFQKSFST